jgi:AraC family transcriptional regulator
MALRQDLERPRPSGNTFAHNAAQLLAVHLVRTYAVDSTQGMGAASVSGGLSEHQVEKLYEYIQRHLCEDLSLETLARLIGFSPYHFARLFRRTMGASPHQFVVRQRLERAQWLLQQTELSLGQVALECGFADQSRLNQVFKQQVGCTPRAYRRGDGH